MSRSSGPTNVPAAPPSSTARKRGAVADAPGQLQQLAERDAEGRPRTRLAASTAPDTQNSLRPVDPSVPRAAKAPPPSRRIGSTLTSVSTLLTTVGLPNSPTSTGNGGLFRGSPRKPSMELKIAVSSPQM